jgi:two-component system sensor histidine kinase VicK
VDDRLGDYVGDERKIKQILLNLLSNAAKFTPEGGRISITANKTKYGVEISVTDTGIGIPRAEQPTIFEEVSSGGWGLRSQEVRHWTRADFGQEVC